MELAKLTVAGVAHNAVLAVQFSTAVFGEVGVHECLAVLKDTIAAVHRGDLEDVEALLTAQAVALNAIFSQMSMSAQTTLGNHLDATDRHLRLALKAQSQCRATVETLAMIKNPPTLFARQTNIAQGPQQVINAMSPAGREVHTLERAGNQKTEQNKLLEAHNERVDGGAADTAGARDRAVPRQANIAQGPQQVMNAMSPAAPAVRGVHTSAREIRKPSRTNYWRRMTSGWTAERRARQARAIGRWRPWERATGPRTVEGKARSARNADRGEQRRVLREITKTLNAELRAQREALARLHSRTRSRVASHRQERVKFELAPLS